MGAAYVDAVLLADVCEFGEEEWGGEVSEQQTIPGLDSDPRLDGWHGRHDVPNLDSSSGPEVWAEYAAADTRGWFNRWWNSDWGWEWHWTKHDEHLGRILGPLVEC